MAVRPDRGERAALDARALDALAEAARAAAAGAPLAEILHALAAAAASAAAAQIALVRVLAPDRTALVVRAVVADSAALAVELHGARVDAGAASAEEATLNGGPAPLRHLADRTGARAGICIPVVVCGDVVGTLELLREAPDFDAGERAAARVAAAQIGLAVRAFGDTRGDDVAAVDERALRVAGDALAAASDISRTTEHVLRLALDVSRASAAALWEPGAQGLELETALGADARGFGGEAAEAAARRALAGGGVHADDVAGLPTVSLRLGEPAFGVLQLVFADAAAPEPDELERLGVFALRAARALAAAARTRRLLTELEQTSALLEIAGQANARLSLAHAVETAVARVSELVDAERVAVYLRENGRLVPAAQRGLGGPHAVVAGALLELAVGAFRGRGAVVLDDARAEPRLARIAGALAEAAIEAVIALPLVVQDEVIGLLGVYPSRGVPLERDATLLAAAAAQLAVAVQNARLHERATRLSAELEQALAAEQEAGRQMHAQYEISRSFAESLSLDDTLAAVARTAAELLEVDAAVLRMPDERREHLRPVAVHVADDALLGPVEALLVRPQRLGGELRRLLRSAQPLLLDVATARALGGSHALLVPFLEKGSTAAVVPIAKPAEVLATLTLVSFRPDRRIDERTIAAAVAIGAQAALAIDNARLYQQQKDFADAMQRSLLPQVRPAVEGLDIGEVYASSAHVDVGGDLYDYVAVDDGRLAVVLGDVTGHGIDAAADMAMAKFVFRSLAREHPEPSRFLAAANEVVVDEIAPGKFITMLYLLIDPRTGEVACASAGHPAPRVVTAGGAVRPIETRGLALGVESGVAYDEVRERLEPGDSVVLYTDGVIEARRGGELYGSERLDALLARRRAARAEDVAAAVVESARRFTGGDLLDDCAVVVVKRPQPE